MIGSSSFRWIPRFADALIPFLFVITQFLLVHSIVGPLYIYCFAMAAFQFNGVWSYYNMYKSAKRHRENDKAFNLLGNMPNLNIMASAFTGISFLVFGLISFVFPSNSTIQLAIPALSFFAALFYVYFAIHIWNGIVNKIENHETKVNDLERNNRGVETEETCQNPASTDINEEI